jgi:hypothetical protein
MARSTIDRLIMSPPYEAPQRHRRYDRETRTFDLLDGRRPAGYVRASEASKDFDDPGRSDRLRGRSAPDGPLTFGIADCPQLTR